MTEQIEHLTEASKIPAIDLGAIERTAAWGDDASEVPGEFARYR